MAGPMRRPLPLPGYLLAFLLFAPTGVALAEEQDPEEEEQEEQEEEEYDAEAPGQSVTIVDDAPEAPRNFANFRAGAGSASENGRAYLCAEVAPFSFLAFEGCGTGSGFLHRDDAPETAHFRSKLRVGSFEFREGFLQPHVSLGFAELQIAEDSPGFDFAGTGPDGVETAGPEAGIGMRLLYPLGRGLEIVGDAIVSYAWMPHAPDLLVPQDEHQLTASFTLGLGF